MADMSQEDKDLTAKYREYKKANPNATADQVLLATTGLVAPTGTGTGGTDYKNFITQAHSANDAQSKDTAAALAPPDTFDASLRELSRARTMRQMRQTSGSAGSIMGIV